MPKTILQLMNVEGMTRENVASHLQKYRLYLKRMAGYPPAARLPLDTLQQVQQVNLYMLWFAPQHMPGVCAGAVCAESLHRDSRRCASACLVLLTRPGQSTAHNPVMLQMKIKLLCKWSLLS